MNNPGLKLIGAILILLFGIQVFMFYLIHEKIEQRFALENMFNQSSQQGVNNWIQDTEHWTPYQELFHMRNQMEQLFNNSLTRIHKNSTQDSLIKIPAIDLKDETDRYVIKADVPGADESTIDVTLNGRQLTISIKTESETKQQDDNNNYQRNERFNGEFQRSLTLPGDVNKDGIKTEYNNGVLIITLPKT